MKKKKTFIIKDWAGNLMNYGTFKSFDAAWDFLFAKFDKDEDLGEYFVEEK